MNVDELKTYLCNEDGDFHILVPSNPIASSLLSSFKKTPPNVVYSPNDFSIPQRKREKMFNGS